MLSERATTPIGPGRVKLVQVLDGDGTLKTPYATERLTSAPDDRQALYNTHSTCLPATFLRKKR